jgi:ribonuclease HII
MLKFKNNINEIGIDEAGRGPLFGPVYAGAVIWDDNLDFDLINDSKKLSKIKRKKAFDWIMDNIKLWGVGYASEKEIDEINILNATKLAMDRAIEDLHKKINDSEFIIINMIIDGVYWEKFNFSHNVESIVKGDTKYYSIACASIIAKEYHDKHIKDLIENHPDLHNKYNLLNNMGYGTKKHIEGIKKNGICEYHRKSFGLCKNY